MEIWTIAIYSTPTNPKIQGQKTISPALICHWKAAENVPDPRFQFKYVPRMLYNQVFLYESGPALPTFKCYNSGWQQV